MEAEEIKKGFLWGVATSAFQLEGSPSSDWTGWDDKLPVGSTVTDHHLHFREDLALLSQLGVNAYRFSLEWSRIQPGEGLWDEPTLARYREMVDILLEHDIAPMVTLHHFSNPLWFSKSYPWHEDTSVTKFLLYARKVVTILKDVDLWITFNEPSVLLLGGYVDGCLPPGLRSFSLGRKALDNIIRAHSEVYDLIHDLNPRARVSIAHNMAVFAPWKKWNPLDRIVTRLAAFYYNHFVLEAFARGATPEWLAPSGSRVGREGPLKLDFVGVNYYMRVHLRFNPLKRCMLEMRHRDLEGSGLSDMGWEIHPNGLRKVIHSASRYGLPLMITENGIATSDSEKRNRYLKSHIEVVSRCVKEGVDMEGYFYWTLLDNYEWLEGMEKKFGLYRVDYETKERLATNSVFYYSHLIEQRRI
jgi:beta-glucosidase